ncbi:hypothetical protein J6590_005580 [Homalodisca vitripennis]|nr:hypothetical protein J6590_005580 [Homalodisca vitripennis]
MQLHRRKPSGIRKRRRKEMNAGPTIPTSTQMPRRNTDRAQQREGQTAYIEHNTKPSPRVRLDLTENSAFRDAQTKYRPCTTARRPTVYIEHNTSCTKHIARPVRGRTSAVSPDDGRVALWESHEMRGSDAEVMLSDLGVMQCLAQLARTGAAGRPRPSAQLCVDV